MAVGPASEEPAVAGTETAGALVTVVPMAKVEVDTMMDLALVMVMTLLE